MEFVLEKDQEETPKDEKVLLITNNVVSVVGKTTLTELKDNLKRHTELRDQYIQSVSEIEQQIADAGQVLK